VEVFTGMLDSYKLEKSELTTIDELTSLHFASRAVMKMKVTEGKGFTETRPGRGTITHEAPAVWKEFDLRLTQTLIPGNNRAYIISCTAEASQFPRFQHTFENAIESFRVLERPPRYGPILTGALQGGLTAAMLPLLFYIVMGVITLVRRGVR
jgi:hypothetical protein